MGLIESRAERKAAAALEKIARDAEEGISSLSQLRDANGRRVAKGPFNVIFAILALASQELNIIRPIQNSGSTENKPRRPRGRKAA